MSEEKIPSTHRDYISALATGLEVLGAFDGQNKEMTLSQVAEKMGCKSRHLLLKLNARLLHKLSPSNLSLMSPDLIGEVIEEASRDCEDVEGAKKIKTQLLSQVRHQFRIHYRNCNICQMIINFVNQSKLTQ